MASPRGYAEGELMPPGRRSTEARERNYDTAPLFLFRAKDLFVETESNFSSSMASRFLLFGFGARKGGSLSARRRARDTE
jgi:hypothetical protein